MLLFCRHLSIGSLWKHVFLEEMAEAVDTAKERHGWGIRNIPLPVLAVPNLEVFASSDDQDRLLSFVGTVVGVQYIKRMAFVEVDEVSTEFF